MLTIEIKIGESFYIVDSIKITNLGYDIDEQTVKLGIEAPEGVNIATSELIEDDEIKTPWSLSMK